MDALDEDELEELEKQKPASDLPPLLLSWGERMDEMAHELEEMKFENIMEKKMKVSNEQKVELPKRKHTLVKKKEKEKAVQ